MNDIELILKKIHECVLKKRNSLFLHSLTVPILPDEIRQLSFIESICLSDMPLRELNIVQEIYPNLSRIVLSKLPFIQDVSSCIASSNKMETICIGETPTHTFPNVSLPKLSLLSLTETKIQHLDFEGISVPNLKSLDLDGSPITMLGGWASVPLLKELYISETNIQSLPHGTQVLPKIEKMSISGEYCYGIVQSLSDDTTLEFLHMTDGDFGYAPLYEKLNRLKSLKRLWITSSTEDKFPEDVFGLSRIHEIRLDFEKLDYVPKELYSMPNLKLIGIYGKQVKHFPIEDILKRPDINYVLDTDVLPNLPEEVRDFMCNRLDD